MGIFDIFLGKGTLKSAVREKLEAEGLVLLEEGLGGTVRYTHFKAPGKRFHGKVTPQKMAVGVSRERFVIYGRAKLADSPFSSPHMDMIDVRLEDDDTVAVHVDYDKSDQPKVSGQIVIRAKTPNAASIVRAINDGLGR